MLRLVCLSKRNNSRSSERIFIKFNIGKLIVVDKFTFLLKSNNNKEYFEWWWPPCVFVRGNDWAVNPHPGNSARGIPSHLRKLRESYATSPPSLVTAKVTDPRQFWHHWRQRANADESCRIVMLFVHFLICSWYSLIVDTNTDMFNDFGIISHLLSTYIMPHIWESGF
jgi:hypothetical protein